jgi:hypothetical protein
LVPLEFFEMLYSCGREQQRECSQRFRLLAVPCE